MSQRFSLLILIVTVALATPVKGRKADMQPASLRKTATHVIVGNVVGIYERTEVKGDWRYTRYVAEIRVTDTEKGEGIDESGMVYARYWKRRWIAAGHMPTSTVGYRGLPREGETVRVYLARNAYDGFGHDNKDGWFNVIGANGFERLKTKPSK